jgi:phosphate transport system substrate-binding protein
MNKNNTNHIHSIFNYKALSRSLHICWVFIFVLIQSACSDYYKNDYKDNSPTSGQLKVYYDEGLTSHVINQVNTFESQYPNVSIDLYQTSENEAVQALYNDSCEAIVISRLLTDKEKKIFESKDLFPNYTAVAKSGVALITNVSTPFNTLSYEQVLELLKKPFSFKDSLGNLATFTVLFDKNNSAVLHYMMDSVLKDTKLSSNCSILNSTLESINYVAQNKNTLAFVDFAWLSDADDSTFKANKTKIKFLAVSAPHSNTFEYPSQSSFKLNTYPFTRTIYVMRKTGDFTLAKGFESFVAGPKGQLTFLKQGLLPTRQAERAITIKMEGQTDNNQ